MDNNKLWHEWRGQFDTDQEAIATAIWIGNRLVKDRAKTTKRKFYSLKDAWIERHQDDLLEGRRVREEGLKCNRCAGTGKEIGGRDGANYWALQDWASLPPEETPDLADLPDGWYVVGDCLKCNGTGKYRSWWLYLHIFEIEGQRYSFHSYVKPSQLSDEPGEDRETYGGRFSEAELEELALPITGLLKVLDHVAHERWGLVFSVKNAGGKYVKWD